MDAWMISHEAPLKLSKDEDDDEAASMSSPQNRQGRGEKHSTRGSSSLQCCLTICVTAAITWSIAGVVLLHGASSRRLSDGGAITGSDGLPILLTFQQLMRDDWNACIATCSSTYTKEKESEEKKSVSPYTGPSRIWQRAKNGFPCHRTQNERRLMLSTPSKEGLLFQRPAKVGSTTMVGVVLRLVHNRSPWLQQSIRCAHRSIHGSARHFEYYKRDRSKSFLFGLVRDPTKRAISQFFHFNVSVHQQEPTDANIIRFLDSRHMRNVYLKDMTLKNFSRTYSPAVNATEVVQDILDGYDFIAVTERMDESLVVMQMLMNLTTKEILYTKARSSGSFSNGHQDRPCVYITPSFFTSGVQEYLASDAWIQTTRGDLMLHQAASASLDRTIDALGRHEFERNLRALRKGLAMAHEACQGRITSLCTEAGVRVPPGNTTCYIWSEGCDHECIDSLPQTIEID